MEAIGTGQAMGEALTSDPAESKGRHEATGCMGLVPATWEREGLWAPSPSPLSA